MPRAIYYDSKSVQTRLVQQSRGISVPPIKGVPVLSTEGGFDFEEDNMFIRWVFKSRQLGGMMSLRESASFADVCVERKLRYDLAK